MKLVSRVSGQEELASRLEQNMRDNTQGQYLIPDPDVS